MLDRGELVRLLASPAPHEIGRITVLVSKNVAEYTLPMSTITEVEKLALDLSETDRALLAAHLLDSLPAVLHDKDGGIAEALRRDAEIDANAKSGMSLEQVDAQVAQRRRS